MSTNQGIPPLPSFSTIPPIYPTADDFIGDDVQIYIDHSIPLKSSITDLVKSGLRVEDPASHNVIMKDENDYLVFRSNSATDSLVDKPFETKDIDEAVNKFCELTGHE